MTTHAYGRNEDAMVPLPPTFSYTPADIIGLDTIYRLQLANPSVSRPSFIARYSSLLGIIPEIPQSLSYPTALLPPEVLLLIHENTIPTSELHSPALILALFGWQNEDPGIPSLVTCSVCFRRLGLWLFRKKAVSIFDSVEEEEEEASVCRLDVIGEHRDVLFSSPLSPILG
jgi:hypothetical protein